MSGKAAKASKKMDSRVARTRDVLGDAMIALMLEKPFEEITVQQVLDRAGVARSTFYTHYRDKDDLFLSDAEEFFEALATSVSRDEKDSNRIAPVCEFFSHVADMREFSRAVVTSGKAHELIQLGRGVFARAVDERLASMPRAHGIAPERRAAVAHAFAGAMFSMLEWWVDRQERPSPAEMDALFHKLVWSGITAHLYTSEI